jgi:hypothetical protein
LGISACTAQGTAAGGNPIAVATSFPDYGFACQIAGDRVVELDQVVLHGERAAK